jgi:peptide-methionine (S)-S-oxide reductase
MKKIIYIAGGCFWGVEMYYKKLKGVIDTEVGYANGNKENPSYEEVKKHLTTHAEALKLEYDNEIISLEKILEHFLRFVDPYSIDKQGEDIGHKYRSGIYYINDLDKDVIVNYFNKVLNNDYKIEILPLSNFYSAEEYHQDYLEKNPNGYCHVNLGLIKNSERK